MVHRLYVALYLLGQDNIDFLQLCLLLTKDFLIDKVQID
jgi:hypothetical protein